MERPVYDKSIGTEDRSVVAATKLWAIAFGFVLLVGIALVVFFFLGPGTRNTGPASGNSTNRPVGP